MSAMRYISAKEYAKNKGLSFGYVYKMMANGKIPFVTQTVTKDFKRIPWDDTIGDAVKES